MQRSSLGRFTPRVAFNENFDNIERIGFGEMYFPNVCIHVKIYTHKSLVGEILGSFNIYGQHHFMVAPMLISSTGGKGGGD